MQMTMRWFGEKFDSVKLWQIRQVPGVTGVITTLYDIPAGELWPIERIQALKKEVEDAGLTIAGIESVNIHDDIKIGRPTRDKYIENYIQTLENLAKCDIKLVCYNFMPVFDWTRTDLAKARPDGATVLAYDQKVVDTIDPQKFFDQTNDSSNGFVMPGWEPERLSHVAELFEAYKDVDSDKLFANLVYFLEAIGPVCEKYGIKMAIHPDDPAWPVFGLPRIITGKDAILRLFKAVDKDYNGLTFCMGSLGSNPDIDFPDLIKACGKRIHFAHVRNLHPEGAAEGLARSSDGADAPQLEEAELFAHQAPGIDVPHVLFEHQKVRADAAVRAVAFAVNVVDGKLLRLGNGAVDEGELVRKAVLVPPGTAVHQDVAEGGGPHALGAVLRLELPDGRREGGVAELFVHGKHRLPRARRLLAREQAAGELVGIGDVDAAARPARDVDGDACAGELVHIAEDGALRAAVLGGQLARADPAAGEQGKEDADERLCLHASFLLRAAVDRRFSKG